MVATAIPSAADAEVDAALGILNRVTPTVGLRKPEEEIARGPIRIISKRPKMCTRRRQAWKQRLFPQAVKAVLLVGSIYREK